MADASYYDLLGVTRNAPLEVIRAAYKALAQKYHPDKNPGDPEAARMMAAINAAIATLMDQDRRRAYDEWLDSQVPKPINDQPESTIPATSPPPTNWYSGWKLWATIAATFVLAKLVGPASAVVTVLIFFWLQPKRGTVLALAASATAGVLVAVVISGALLSRFNSNPPLQQVGQSIQPTPSPPIPTKPSTNNPFRDPSYGENVAATKPLLSTDQPAPQPSTAQTADHAKDEHYRQIYAAHPDADAIFSSANFRQWVATNPRFQNTASTGSTQEVIAMFSAFKQRVNARPYTVDAETMRRNEAAAEALDRRNQLPYPR